MQPIQRDDHPSSEPADTGREIRRLVRELDIMKFRRREAAARLSEIGAPAIEPLKAALRRDELFRRICNGLLYPVVLYMGFRWTNIYLDDGWSGLSVDRIFLDLWIAACLIIWPSLLALRRPFIATALAGIEDPEAIGPLIEGLGIAALWDPEIRRSVIHALAGSVARIEPGGGITLTNHQVECLHHNLNGSNAFTAITVLQVIEKLGDQRSLRTVERFLTRFPRQANPVPSLSNDVITHASALSDGSLMPAEAQYRVRLAAEACLAALRERAAKADQNTTLLRASDPVDDPQAELLRSTEPHDTGESEHLVRPASDEAS
jgi:hypothetical protein